MTRSTSLGLAIVIACSAVAGAQTAEPAPQPAPSPRPEPGKSPQKKRTKPVVFGYVQTHYRHARDSSADGVVDAPNFRVQRVRLGVRGDVFPWLSYDIEFDPRAPDVGSVLRDAFLAFRFIPHHQLRLGQQKTQFGYENRESSSELYAVNRTELADTLSRGVNLRDIGVGLVGHANLGGGWRLEDAVTLVNGAGLNVQDDTTRRKNLWGRVGLRYRNRPGDLTVWVGASAATGDQRNEGADPLDPDDDFQEEIRRVGADVELDHGRFFASAEYVRGTNENPATGERDEPHGYYVSVAGKTPWQVGPMVRLDTVGDEFRRWTLGVYYGLPRAPFRAMVNYEYRALRDGARADDKFYVWTQVRF
jgi:hypothetical protein